MLGAMETTFLGAEAGRVALCAITTSESVGPLGAGDAWIFSDTAGAFGAAGCCSHATESVQNKRRKAEFERQLFVEMLIMVGRVFMGMLRCISFFFWRPADKVVL
jgi:hypothetical protein